MVQANLIKSLTPLLLGGAVIVVAGSFIAERFSKSDEGETDPSLRSSLRGSAGGIADLFRGVGEIGRGAGTVGTEVADAVKNIVDVTDPFGETFRGSASRIQQEFDQASIRDQILEDIRIEGAAERENIRQQEKTKRKEIFESEKTQQVQRFSIVDDKILSFGKSAVKGFTQFFEVGSVVGFSPFTTSGLSGAVAKALVDGSGTQGRTLDSLQEPILQSIPSETRDLRPSSSGGSSFTLAPTPREVSLKQSLPASERNKPPMSIAQPSDLKPRTLRSKVSSFFSRFF